MYKTFISWIPLTKTDKCFMTIIGRCMWNTLVRGWGFVMLYVGKFGANFVCSRYWNLLAFLFSWLDFFYFYQVVPSLRGKHGELMLTELVKRWSKYKVMMTWLIRLFFCLQHWCTEESYLPNIKEVAIACFRNQVWFTTFYMIPLTAICFKDTCHVRLYLFQVYQEVKANARDVVINLVSSLLLDSGFL